MSNRRREKKPQQKPISKGLFIQRIKKGETWQARKLSDNNNSTPAKHHRKHYGFTPTHASKSKMGSLDFHNCEALIRHSVLTLSGVCQRRPSRYVGSLGFYPSSFPWSHLRGSLEEIQGFQHHSMVIRILLLQKNMKIKTEKTMSFCICAKKKKGER